MKKKKNIPRVQLEIQNGESGMTEELLVARAKEAWRNTGHSIDSIEALDLYVKPEDNRTYYVINKSSQGSFCLF